MSRRRPTWKPVPDRVLAEQAEVAQRRADGLFLVINLNETDDKMRRMWWLVPSQMGGGQVGDVGKVVYRSTPSSGLAYFVKQ